MQGIGRPPERDEWFASPYFAAVRAVDSRLYLEVLLSRLFEKDSFVLNCYLFSSIAPTTAPGSMEFHQIPSIMATASFSTPMQVDQFSHINHILP